MSSSTVRVVNVFQNSSPPKPKKPPSDKSKKPWSKSRSLWTMRICNWLNGALLVTGGICTFLIPTGTTEVAVDTIVLASYVVFMGLLMCCLELNLGLLQDRIRRNFGCMFSFGGRAAFILFSASVAVSLGNTESLFMFAIGGLTILNAAFNVAVVCSHPEFSTSDDPFAAGDGGESGEGIMAQYLANNPKVAVSVLQGLQALPLAPEQRAALQLALGAAKAASSIQDYSSSASAFASDSRGDASGGVGSDGYAYATYVPEPVPGHGTYANVPMATAVYEGGGGRVGPSHDMNDRAARVARAIAALPPDAGTALAGAGGRGTPPLPVPMAIRGRSGTEPAVVTGNVAFGALSASRPAVEANPFGAGRGRAGTGGQSASPVLPPGLPPAMPRARQGTLDVLPGQGMRGGGGAVPNPYATRHAAQEVEEEGDNPFM